MLNPPVNMSVKYSAKVPSEMPDVTFEVTKSVTIKVSASMKCQWIDSRSLHLKMIFSSQSVLFLVSLRKKFSIAQLSERQSTIKYKIYGFRFQISTGDLLYLINHGWYKFLELHLKLGHWTTLVRAFTLTLFTVRVIFSTGADLLLLMVIQLILNQCPLTLPIYSFSSIY